MVEHVAATIRNAVDRVKTYKERAELLLEIENLHSKICSLEGKHHSKSKVYDSSGNLIRGPLLDSLPGFRPDAFLEKPLGNTNRTLVTLQALKDLKRDGIISDLELHKLKQLIIVDRVRQVMKILIVEDDVMLGELLEERLLRLEHERVRVCLTGLEAFEVINEEAFDCAFVDVGLPDMDGL